LAYAQDVPKFEIGGQFTINRLRDLSETDSGMGVRVGYNITKSLAAEAEFNYFPKDLDDATGGAAYSSNRTQGLFGVKYMALRGDKMAIGGKVRPGFVRFNGTNANLFIPGTFFSQLANGSTKFAMDFGGVFEYYPTKKTVVRFDVGDTIVRFGQTLNSNSFTSNNLQITAGFGFRF
jgi:hypothetical protein